MDQDTYEETRLARDDWAKFLKEGAICSLLFYSGKVRARCNIYHM
jgi:translation elongation factor P/translation initiation factor 5A